MPLNDESKRLQTADEIAEFLQVTPRAVYLWAEQGRIPTAYRNGKTVRFRLEDVQQCLNPSTSDGEGRYVELVVMALSLVCGPSFPRIPKIDLGSITMDEVTQLETLCAAYAADLANLFTPQEQIAYCEGVLQAARLLKDEG